MGYIVFVTDKHKGPQTELSYDELKKEMPDFITYYYRGEIPRSITNQFEKTEKPEISGNIIRIEPSDEAIIEEQNRLKEIISNQQKHIMRLERLLQDKGVSNDEISALPKEDESRADHE